MSTKTGKNLAPKMVVKNDIIHSQILSLSSSSTVISNRSNKFSFPETNKDLKWNLKCSATVIYYRYTIAIQDYYELIKVYVLEAKHLCE